MAADFIVEFDANAHSKKDGNYVSGNARNVKENTMMQEKRKNKEKKKMKELVERVGAMWCSMCINTSFCCWVDLVVIGKWKEDVAYGMKVTWTLSGVVCTTCAGRRQKCFLPELV